MPKNENRAGGSRSAKRGPLTRLLKVFLLTSAAITGLIGVAATGVFDWRLQQLIADHGAKNQMNIELVDNSATYFSDDRG